MSSLETGDGLEAVGCHFVRLQSLAQWVRGTCWASPTTWVQSLEPMSRWKARTLVFNIYKMFHSHEVYTSENPHFPQHACEYWHCIQRSTPFSLCPSLVWLSPPFGMRHRCWTSLFILSKPIFLFLLCGPKLLEARSMAGKFALKSFCGFLWYRLPEVYLEERNPVPGDEVYPTHSPFLGSIYNFVFPSLNQNFLGWTS